MFLGEIWFDESSQIRVIKWLKKNKIAHDTSILDIGTGNACMLVELYNEGYHKLVGIDYSEKSVELAKKITQDNECLGVELKVVDILTNAMQQQLGVFDIIHDKGTFDAIGLMHNAQENLKTYVQNVSTILNDDHGYLIITSCNFTETELVDKFGSHFEKLETLPTQTFQFGGKVGNKTTSLVFTKKKRKILC
jgi:SAM-dependent methyltransferase